MATKQRMIVRSVIAGQTFNGVTSDTATGYFPVPTQNARSFKSGNTVGRFGFGLQGRKGIAPCLAKVRVYGTIQGGDRVEIHSGVSGDAPVGDRANDPVGTSATGPVELAQIPQNQPLQTFALTNNFDGPWMMLGPTDAICVFHTAAVAGDTVEILILEGDPAELAAVQCCAQECDCSDCDIDTLEAEGGSEGNLELEAWDCEQSIVVSAGFAGQVVTLPLLTGMTLGAQAFVRREAGTPWFTLAAAAGEDINGVTSPAGIIFEDDDKGVLIRAAAGGWMATDIVPQLTPVLVAGAAITAWSGDKIFNLQTASATVTLPSTADIAPGQKAWITNRNVTNVLVTLVLDDPGTENIDQQVGGTIALPNIGDTVMLERDGSAGWRTTTNAPFISVEQRLVNVAASQTLAVFTATQTLVHLNVTVAGTTVALPAIPFTVDDYVRIAKIVNVGTENVTLSAGVGQSYDVVATTTTVLAPGQGIEVQPWSGTIWTALKGSTL